MDEQKELQNDSTPLDTAIQSPIEVTPDIDIPTLRTYKGDINQTVNRDKISTAKILIAEQNRQKVRQEKVMDTSIKRPTNILVLILSIALIVVSLGAIGYFGYTKVMVKIIEPVKVPMSFLFIFDQEKFIEVSQDTLNLFQDVQKEVDSLASAKNETYTDIIFYKTNSGTKENVRISSLEFFNLFDISLPINIKRSISNNFVYGMYKTDGRMEPFLVLGINDYETMYSSMFIWESTLALDIKDLFPVLRDLFDLTKNKQIQINTDVATTTQTTSTSTLATSTNATTTAPSIDIAITPEEQKQLNIEKTTQINRTIRFIDIVFSNKDARAVRDPNGNPFFYYSFIDKTKIIFAQDPKLLTEISRKIKEKNLVR
jgi:hypothetical protein